MANYRRDRINDQMCCEMANILRDIKDPRVSRYLVTVTRCDVTPDLKYAKIYYSVFADRNRKIDHKDLKAGLYSAIGFVRRRLAQTLNLRITPELTFIEDDSIAHGARINELLHGVEEDIARFAQDEAQRQKALEEEDRAAGEEERNGEDNG